jgi:hypothetical protein
MQQMYNVFTHCRHCFDRSSRACICRPGWCTEHWDQSTFHPLCTVGWNPDLLLTLNRKKAQKPNMITFELTWMWSNVHINRLTRLHSSHFCIQKHAQVELSEFNYSRHNCNFTFGERTEAVCCEELLLQSFHLTWLHPFCALIRRLMWLKKFNLQFDLICKKKIGNEVIFYSAVIMSWGKFNRPYKLK